MVDMKTINLAEVKEKKKESEEDLIFRKNIFALDASKKEFFEVYLETERTMKKLFELVGQGWRDPQDHLPLLVIDTFKTIFDQLNSKGGD